MKKIKIINIEGIRYEVELIPGKRRTVSLKMVSSLVIELRYPSYFSGKKALEFVQRKSDWISKKHVILKASESAGAGRGIFEGRLLFYAGQEYKVAIGGKSITIGNDGLHVPPEYNQSDIEEWYRCRSRELVNDFINDNSCEIPDCSIKVKKQKSIWGSCNSKRRIYINSRISMCPPNVVEYILWHEICHLTHMNHSKEFYKLLSEHCPDYRSAKSWLKKHNQFLHI